MIKEFKGTVDKIDVKEGSVGVNINGRWFTAWKDKVPEVTFVEGDYVEGTYLEKENPSNDKYPYMNIMTIEVKSKPVGWDEKQEVKETRIIRQTCFKAACDAYEWDSKKETSRQTDIILEIAKAGEKYILEKES